MPPGRQKPKITRFVSFEGMGDLLGYGLVYKLVLSFFVSVKTAVTETWTLLVVYFWKYRIKLNTGVRKQFCILLKI